VSGRFKRSLLGYSPREVDTAFAAQEAALAQGASSLAAHAAMLEAATERVERGQLRIDQLDLVCQRLAERLVERDREFSDMDRELAVIRAEGERRLDALALLAEELNIIRCQARGQATRIRVRALRDAAELGVRITEATRRPVESRERLLDGIQEAIARLGAQWEEPLEAIEEVGEPVMPSALDLYDGMIEIDVGPLEDFSQLVGFEDAAGGISATSEISVKRFAAGRATLAMKLDEPIELLRELEERAPFEFQVRDQRFDRLVLDVDAR